MLRTGENKPVCISILPPVEQELQAVSLGCRRAHSDLFRQESQAKYAADSAERS